MNWQRKHSKPASRRRTVCTGPSLVFTIALIRRLPSGMFNLQKRLALMRFLLIGGIRTISLIKTSIVEFGRRQKT